MRDRLLSLWDTEQSQRSRKPDHVSSEQGRHLERSGHGSSWDWTAPATTGRGVRAGRPTAIRDKGDKDRQDLAPTNNSPLEERCEIDTLHL